MRSNPRFALIRARKIRLTLAIVGFLALGASFIVLLLALATYQTDFEGTLLVREFGFTLKQPTHLLSAVRGITQLDVHGKQFLTLEGKFQIKTPIPKSFQGSLMIELMDDLSYWTITPDDSGQPNQIEINQLSLEENTKVRQLRYNPSSSSRTLSLTVEPPNWKRKSKLKLSLGSQALKLQLNNYKIPKLNLSNSSSLDLIFQPSSSELPPLELSNSTALSMILPDPTSSDASLWLSNNLDVKDVQLEESQDTADIQRVVSSILSGKIRMPEQILNIEPEQFLIVGTPGIKRISQLRIKSPEKDNSGGLELFIAGTTAEVKTGLDKKFPINKMRSSFLIQYFSQNTISALIGIASTIAAGIIGSVLVTVFESMWQ